MSAGTRPAPIGRSAIHLLIRAAAQRPGEGTLAQPRSWPPSATTGALLAASRYASLWPAPVMTRGHTTYGTEQDEHETSEMQNFFRQVETRAHAWPAGRRDLHWHVLFEPEDVQKKLTGPYRGLTHRPGIEPVAPEWLHMTVLHSGPAEESSDQELADITARVRQACGEIAPFDVTFSPPSVGNVAIECLGRPGPPARRLWQLTHQATVDVVGDRWPLIPASYYPHTSLGYGTQEAEQADRTEMKIWLSDHGHGEVTLRATQLSLVSQWHDRRRIMWDHLNDIPFGG